MAPDAFALPKWVRVGSECRWWSKSQKTYYPIMITTIDSLKKRVVVHFKYDNKIWKIVPFSQLGPHCPMQPPVSESVFSSVALAALAESGTATPPWYESLSLEDCKPTVQQNTNQQSCPDCRNRNGGSVTLCDSGLSRQDDKVEDTSDEDSVQWYETLRATNELTRSEEAVQAKKIQISFMVKEPRPLKVAESIETELGRATNVTDTATAFPQLHEQGCLPSGTSEIPSSQSSVDTCMVSEEQTTSNTDKSKPLQNLSAKSDDTWVQMHTMTGETYYWDRLNDSTCSVLPEGVHVKWIQQVLKDGRQYFWNHDGESTWDLQPLGKRTFSSPQVSCAPSTEAQATQNPSNNGAQPESACVANPSGPDLGPILDLEAVHDAVDDSTKVREEAPMRELSREEVPTINVCVADARQEHDHEDGQSKGCGLDRNTNNCGRDVEVNLAPDDVHTQQACTFQTVNGQADASSAQDDPAEFVLAELIELTSSDNISHANSTAHVREPLKKGCGAFGVEIDDDWVQCQAQSGQTYFWNRRNDSTRWELPARTYPKWVRHTMENGKTYFWNHDGQALWELPPLAGPAVVATSEGDPDDTCIQVETSGTQSIPTDLQATENVTSDRHPTEGLVHNEPCLLHDVNQEFAETHHQTGQKDIVEEHKAATADNTDVQQQVEVHRLEKLSDVHRQGSEDTPMQLSACASTPSTEVTQAVDAPVPEKDHDGSAQGTSEEATNLSVTQAIGVPRLQEDHEGSVPRPVEEVGNAPIASITNVPYSDETPLVATMKKVLETDETPQVADTVKVFQKDGTPTAGAHVEKVKDQKEEDPEVFRLRVEVAMMRAELEAQSRLSAAKAQLDQAKCAKKVNDERSLSPQAHRTAVQHKASEKLENASKSKNSVLNMEPWISPGCITESCNRQSERSRSRHSKQNEIPQSDPLSKVLKNRMLHAEHAKCIGDKKDGTAHSSSSKRIAGDRKSAQKFQNPTNSESSTPKTPAHPSTLDSMAQQTTTTNAAQTVDRQAQCKKSRNSKRKGIDASEPMSTAPTVETPTDGQSVRPKRRHDRSRSSRSLRLTDQHKIAEKNHSVDNSEKSTPDIAANGHKHHCKEQQALAARNVAETTTCQSEKTKSQHSKRKRLAAGEPMSKTLKTDTPKSGEMREGNTDAEAILGRFLTSVIHGAPPGDWNSAVSEKSVSHSVKPKTKQLHTVGWQSHLGA